MIPSDWWEAGLSNLVLTLVMALLVWALAYHLKLGVSRELAMGSGRATLQLLAMSLVLVAIFNSGPLFDVLGVSTQVWLSVGVLTIMGIFAAHTSAQRAAPLPQAFPTNLAAVALGPGLVLLLLGGSGTLEMEARWLIPVGSMAFGNGMVINSLALERLRSEASSDRALIETALALGATGQQALEEPIRTALRSGLIPTLDRLKTTGLVWIPGAMTGMLLAGEDPVWAATFQLVIFLMIILSGLISGAVALRLMGRHLFTDQEQLISLDLTKH